MPPKKRPLTLNDEKDDTSRPSIKRQKRHKTVPGTSTIKCGLKRICKKEDVRNVLEDFVKRMSLIRFESSKLLNLYLLHRFENEELKDKPLGKIDQIVVDRAMMLVSTNSRECRNKDDNGDTNKSMEDRKAVNELSVLQHVYETLYTPCRPTHLLQESRDNLTDIRQSAREEMLTNAKNHVVMNFERWTRQWIKNKFLSDHPEEKSNWKSLNQTYQFAVTFREEDINKRNSTIESKEHRDWILETSVIIRKVLLNNGIFCVTETSLAEVWYKFLPWLHIVQQTFQKYPERRGNRMFTLFPDHDPKPMYIQLNNTSVKSLCAYLRKKKILKPQKSKDKNGHPWSQIFAFKRLRLGRAEDTISKSFADHIRTDGVAVSVMISNPKRQVEGVEKENDNKDNKEKEKEPDESDSKLHKSWTKIDLAENKAQRIVGIDPGRVNMFQAVDQTGKTIRCRGKEYQTLCGSRSRHKKMTAWIKKNPKVDQNLQRMPSARVATVVEFQAHLHHVLGNLEDLSAFYFARRQRNLRWKTFITKQKALDHLCKRVTQGDRETIVAFGAAEFSSCSKGHAPTNRKEFKRRLRSHCRHVVDVDEYLTSQVCSQCHRRNLKYPSKTISIKNSHTGVSRSQKVPIRGVQACNSCGIVWNRDTNSARNILALFHFANHFRDKRMKCFARPTNRHNLSFKGYTTRNLVMRSCDSNIQSVCKVDGHFTKQVL